MELGLSSLNWIAIIVCVLIGQLVSTIWFVVLFGESWAKEYGVQSKQQHTKEIPSYVYGVGLLSTIILTISIAILERALNINSLPAGFGLGVFLAIGFCCSTILPGQAFLKRWKVFLIAGGSQSTLILVISSILSIWK